MLSIKVGHKPIKQYISAALVHWRTNEDKSIKVCARGKLISRAVDVVEIVKRFNEPKLKVNSIVIGTEEYIFHSKVPKPEYTNYVSTIEILLKETK